MKGENSDAKTYNKQPNQQSKVYMEKVRIFIETYKTKPCTREKPHNGSQCVEWHTKEQQRRCPYDGHSFAYSPQYHCTCVETHNDKCEGCLNSMEKLFHPIMYKTELCTNYYQCPHGLRCPYLHEEDNYHFQYGQFFRFDLATFKTRPCPKKNNKGQYPDSHERRTCNYFHSEGDRRRPNVNDYTHVVCSNPKNCQQKCNFAHNKIEQLYHPSRYKSKFCQSYPNQVIKCHYREFCSFAHVQSQITIELIHLQDPTPEFHIYLYKTVWCPYIQSHERGNCVYAHNFQDFRRNPAHYKYKPERCPQWNFVSDDIKSIQQAGCKNGMKCEKAHGWMEPKFHPMVYKKCKSKKDCDNQELIHTLANYEKNKLGQKFTGMYQVGSPFFKVERQYSESSRKTKAKTANNTSDRSNDGSSNRDKEEYIKSERGAQEGTITLTILQEGYLWKNNKDQNQATFQNSALARAKSMGKPDEYDMDYSKSIKDMLEETSILAKLKEKRINEVKIINLRQNDIKTLGFLTSSEKEILSRKLHEYTLKRDPNSINYSPDLTKFFVRKRCERILQKMRTKKVKQSKLLNLFSTQIKDMSFLSIEQKEELPKIIRQFANDKEFEELNRLIKGETKC